MTKEIDIQKQPVLRFGRVFRIALTGVRYRLFRAIVTVAVIMVAMAFLMNILSESLIKRSIGETSREQIRAMRQVDQWIARLSVAQTAGEIITAMASTQDEAQAGEICRFADIEQKQYDEMVRLAQQALRYLSFFSNLDYGRRRVLVGNAEQTRIFDRLQNAEHLRRFEDNLDQMKSVHFAASPQAYRAFLQQWPDLRAFIQQVRDGQTAAIKRVQAGRNNRSMLEVIEQVNGPFGDVIRQAGFTLSPGDAEDLVRQAQRTIDMQLIDDTINNNAIRRAVAARRDVLPGDVMIDMIWDMVGHPDRADWFIGVMVEKGVDPGRIDSTRLVKLAEYREHAKMLVRAERATLDAEGGFMGMGERMTWLAFVSMLVCVVGISNAMLMSVTERFREIATLKCLGALDGFIMTLFLIEAGLLGLVGGVIGTLLGLIIGMARMAAAFHALLADALPLQALLVAAGISIVLGVVLAAVAAVYPSLRAARLAPMEAMRIE
jgi:putative ABC transport system permease protein